jgi:nicotinamide-nucleotide amidase
VELRRVEIVGDRLEDLTARLGGLLAAGVELVCTTGGLGPTHDDLTMEAVALATGRALALDEEALAMVQARQRALGSPAPGRAGAARKQATLPEGAAVLPPAGTAPGCVLEHGDTVVVVLPGPPWELAAMWEEALAREPVAGLLARARPPDERVLRLHGVPEHRAVAALEDLDPAAWGALRLGICARDGELELTARTEPGGDWAARALEERLLARFGAALFSRDGRTVDDLVADALLAGGRTVAVAESCTGGGLGARLTARPGSSAYVVGGVISYSDAVKRDLLGVEPEVIRRHGAVSAECAAQMALGVRRLMAADWALSITGIAGPGGGTADKPVGLVYVGLAGEAGVETAEHRLRGGREAVRRRAVALALHALRGAIAPV